MIRDFGEGIEERVGWVWCFGGEGGGGMRGLVYWGEWVEREEEFKKRMGGRGVERGLDEVGNL